MRLPFAIGTLLLVATGAVAEGRKDFDIAPQGLPSALELLIEQADMELLYDSKAVTGKTSAGAVGQLTIAEAVARIMRGTGLGYTFTSATTVAIHDPAAPVHAPRPVRTSAAPPDALPVMLVSATRKESVVGEVPATADVVTSRELQTRHLSTIDQALNTTPGGYFRRGKGLMDTSANISLRGFPTMRRTAILLNGIPMNDTYTGDARLASINLDDVERIEVVRGPFSSLYGSNAMGGVVNILTKEPAGTHARIRLGYGDAFDSGDAPEGSFSASASGSLQPNDRLGLRASLGHRSTSGYPTHFIGRTAPLPPELTGAEASTDSQGNPRHIIGHSGNNGYEDRIVTLGGKYRFAEAGSLRIEFTRSRSRYEYKDPRSILRDAGGNERFIGATGNAHQAIATSNYLSGPGGAEQDQVIASYDSTWGDLGSKLVLGYINQRDGWFVTPGTAVTAAGGPGADIRTATSHRAADWQIEVPLGVRHILTAGAFYRMGDARNTEHSLDDWRNRGSRTALTYETEGKELTYALFLQDRYEVSDKVTAYLGLRQDWWKTSDGLANSVGVSGYPIHYATRRNHQFSPKAALVYKRTPATHYRIAAGRSFRAPAVFELYRTWLSPLSGTTFQSNATLNPETATSWEIGVDHTLTGGTNLTATYFSNRMKDFIYRIAAASPAPVQRFENAAEAHSRGVELGLNGRVGALSWHMGYTHTDALIDRNSLAPASEGKRITQIPKNAASAVLDWERGRLHLNLTIRHIGDRFNRDDNSDVDRGVPGSYDRHTLIDTRIDYRLTDRLSASLSIDNLTGEEWYDFYRSPGPSWFAQLALDI